jgi:formamidopyrimidine-DNA glycosylase
MIVKAFGFDYENADVSPLNVFSTMNLSPREQKAAAYLFSQRYIVGCGNTLNAQESITRADL